MSILLAKRTRLREPPSLLHGFFRLFFLPIRNSVENTWFSVLGMQICRYLRAFWPWGEQLRVFYVSRGPGVSNCVYFTCPAALGCQIACILRVPRPWVVKLRVFYMSRRPGVSNCVYFTCPGALGCQIACILASVL